MKLPTGYKKKKAKERLLKRMKSLARENWYSTLVIERAVELARSEIMKK